MHSFLKCCNERLDPFVFVEVYKELAHELDELETRIERKLESHDQAITGLINTIRELMKPPETKKRPIGFVTPQEKK